MEPAAVFLLVLISILAAAGLLLRTRRRWLRRQLLEPFVRPTRPAVAPDAAHTVALLGDPIRRELLQRIGRGYDRPLTESATGSWLRLDLSDRALNVVTCAADAGVESVADLARRASIALMVVDVRRGTQPLHFRHAVIAAGMGVPTVSILLAGTGDLPNTPLAREMIDTAEADIRRVFASCGLDGYKAEAYLDTAAVELDTPIGPITGLGRMLEHLAAVERWREQPPRPQQVRSLIALLLLPRAESGNTPQPVRPLDRLRIWIEGRCVEALVVAHEPILADYPDVIALAAAEPVLVYPRCPYLVIRGGGAVGFGRVVHGVGGAAVAAADVGDPVYQSLLAGVYAAGGQPFPAEYFRPLRGRFWGSGEHYQIEITLQPFRFNGRPAEPVILIADMALPIARLADAAGQRYEFPVAPADGFLMGQMTLPRGTTMVQAGWPYPEEVPFLDEFFVSVDVPALRFGAVHGRQIDVEVSAVVGFVDAGTGYRDLRTILALPLWMER